MGASLPLAVEEIVNNGKKIMWNMVEYRELEMVYSSAIKEVETKFDVLNSEFDVRYRRNPISSMHSRLKSRDSVLRKLVRYGYTPSIDNIKKHVKDFAGIRIICSYIDDIYSIADAFLAQDDITLIERKDYIKEPKPSGYRSLHLIVSVPVFFANGKRSVTVEVQIRTVAMNFWASLEHQMKYKRRTEISEEIVKELRVCSDGISAIDERMIELRDRIEAEEDAPGEDELLIERLSRLI